MSRPPDVAGLSLSAGIARRLLAHARRELPNESCALLGGDRAAGRVTTAYPARNLLASPYRYEVDPHDLVRIVHAIERHGDDLVAIFHSHPAGPAAPSAPTCANRATGVLHLLASPSRRRGPARMEDRGRGAFEVPLTIDERAAGVALPLGGSVEGVAQEGGGFSRRTRPLGTVVAATAAAADAGRGDAVDGVLVAGRRRRRRSRRGWPAGAAPGPAPPPARRGLTPAGTVVAAAAAAGQARRAQAVDVRPRRAGRCRRL